MTVSTSWSMHTPPSAPLAKTLVILGEAPGADEEKAGVPFVGASGRLLRETLLPAANLNADNFHLLNVFTARPPNNNLDEWTANKTELKKMGLQPWGHPLKRGRYLLPEHHWHLAELEKRLEQLKPDLIVCMGGVALWAMTGESAITTYRGTFFSTRFSKAIATIHPAATIREWSYLPLTWADLRKVRMWLDGTLPEPAKRKLWINPTMAEIAGLYFRLRAQPRNVLGVDIETSPAAGQITTIQFSTTNEGICIPFWEKETGRSYWPTAKEEVQAWRWVQRYAQLPNPKALQNGLYDSQWLLDAPIEIRLRNWAEDTAIMHHAYQPELQKALGVIASLHLNEPSWKQMRTKAKDMNKGDE